MGLGMGPAQGPDIRRLNASISRINFLWGTILSNLIIRAVSPCPKFKTSKENDQKTAECDLWKNQIKNSKSIILEGMCCALGGVLFYQPLSLVAHGRRPLKSTCLHGMAMANRTWLAPLKRQTTLSLCLNIMQVGIICWH